MGKDSQKPILVAPCMTCIQAAHASQSPLASRCLYNNNGKDPVTPGIFMVIQKLCFLCLVCLLSPGWKHFSLQEIAIHHKHWLIGKALRLTANSENVTLDSLPNNARQFLKISMYGNVAQYQSTNLLYKWPQHHIKSNISLCLSNLSTTQLLISQKTLVNIDFINL